MTRPCFSRLVARRTCPQSFSARLVSDAPFFDDMVGRSVPFYAELQRMTAEIASDFAVDGTNLYDLGCSTGTTLPWNLSAMPPK